MQTGPIKEGLHGQRFADNDTFIATAKKRVTSIDLDFHEHDIQDLVARWLNAEPLPTNSAYEGGGGIIPVA